MTARLPLEPLLRFGAQRAGLPVCPAPSSGCADCSRGRHYYFSRLAVDLGVSPSTPHTWRAQGMSVRSADRAAVEGFGLHPTAVWDNWYQITTREDDI